MKENLYPLGENGCCNKPTSKCIMAHIQEFISCPYKTHNRCSGKVSFWPPQDDAGAPTASFPWFCFLQHIACRTSVLFSHQLEKSEQGEQELGDLYEPPLTARQSETCIVAVSSGRRVSGDRQASSAPDKCGTLSSLMMNCATSPTPSTPT